MLYCYFDFLLFLCAYAYRYNEFDQPVCRVCDVVLKSESLWDAHQVSRKHREVIIFTISFIFSIEFLFEIFLLTLINLFGGCNFFPFAFVSAQNELSLTELLSLSGNN